MHISRCLMVTVSMAFLAVAGPARAGTGTITAEPNPCRVEAGKLHCTTYLSWSTEGVTDARVYVKREGRERTPAKEFATGNTQNRVPADWIAEGTRYLFTLYDFSSGSRGPALASVTVTSTK